jgi:hypothetical protein
VHRFSDLNRKALEVNTILALGGSGEKAATAGFRGGSNDMIQPQSLDVLLGEYSELHRVWAIRAWSGKFLSLPDQRFPGRRPVRFFTNEYDAMRVRDAVLDAKPMMFKYKFEIVEVPLLDALRKVKADTTPPIADSFVLNTHDEVYPLISQLKPKPITRHTTPSEEGVR